MSDLVILYMTDFDIILDMSCLSLYCAMLDCNIKSVTLEILWVEKLECEVVYKVKQAKIISFLWASKLVKQVFVSLFGI